MDGFFRVGAAADLAPGQCREVQAGGKDVALFNIEGTFYALSNRCSHRGGPLGQGFLDGCMVTCPWHDWTYDVRSGAHSAGIAGFAVPRYEVRIADGDVWVRPETETAPAAQG
jgi:nitrite reductase/ring-hydroxylating ferredoxin subunit